jgi:hypothetical protein
VSFLGGILLVAYPVSDAVATVVDLRRSAAGWPQLVNLGPTWWRPSRSWSPSGPA